VIKSRRRRWEGRVASIARLEIHSLVGFDNLNVIKHLGDLAVLGRIILKLLLKK
jgi:hypothetical protein